LVVLYEVWMAVNELVSMCR